LIVIFEKVVFDLAIIMSVVPTVKEMIESLAITTITTKKRIVGFEDYFTFIVYERHEFLLY